MIEKYVKVDREYLRQLSFQTYENMHRIKAHKDMIDFLMDRIEKMDFQIKELQKNCE